jgi:hypothetical protein
LLVSSAIAVVMTRVKPSMLPPTTITAPTSAAARPKPASSTVSSSSRPSQSSVGTARQAPTPKERSCSAYSSHSASSTCRVRAARIGVTSTACAMIIAPGVNSRPRLPSGPERESSR